MISQSVKDVVQSLVDDDLGSKEKIGTSVSFEMKSSVIHYFVYPVCIPTLLFAYGSQPLDTIVSRAL